MLSLLLDMPDNPVPARGAANFIIGVDGKRIRYAVFKTDSRPERGTVVLLTGRNECIEKYFETIESLQARGFTVVCMDWRGQGLSDRIISDPHPGHVRDFSIYAQDLNQLFSDVVLPDCRGPYYVLAHSTGSLVSLAALPYLKNRVQRMVLIAPLLGVEGLPLSVDNLRRMTGVLKHLGFSRRYASGGAWRPIPFAENVVTTDRARFERNTRLYETYPQLSLGGPTISWMNAAVRTSRMVSDPDYMAGIRMPILFIGAGNDTVVSTRAIELYASRVRGADCITIDGARHEILQERDAYLEQFWAAFDAFITQPALEPA